MTIFTGTPEPESSERKFMRVYETIFVSKHDDMWTAHGELLADEDHLIRFAEAYNEKPDEVDAGFVDFEPEGKRVTIRGRSQGLDIPRVPESRLKTASVMQELLPDYEVKNLMPQGLRSKE